MTIYDLFNYYCIIFPLVKIEGYDIVINKYELS